WQTCRRSASGCFSADTMRATTTPSSASPSGTTSSTSRPMAVRVAASSSRVAVVGTCWRSQFSENFIAVPGRQVQWADARASGELAQEAQVVVEEAAQVVDAVAQHREALHAQA